MDCLGGGDRERREIYEQFIDELRKREKEQERKMREQQSHLFYSLLNNVLGMTGNDEVLFWRQVQPQLEKIILNEPDYSLLKTMPLFDQLLQFEDWIKEREKLNLSRETTNFLQKIKILKDSEDRLKGEVNEKLDLFYKKLEGQGKVWAKMKWQSFRLCFSDDDTTAMNDFSKEFTSIIVEDCVEALVNPIKKWIDFQEKLRSRYYQEKANLLDISALRPIHDKSFEDFMEFAKSLVPLTADIKISILRTFYEEMKVFEKEEKRLEETKLRHLKYDTFKDALKTKYSPGLSPDTKWQDVK